MVLGIKLWAFGKLSTVALSCSVKALYFFYYTCKLFLIMINFCGIHLLVIEVFFDYSGIFQLTVLIRRIDFCLHGYDLGNDYDRDC